MEGYITTLQRLAHSFNACPDFGPTSEADLHADTIARKQTGTNTDHAADVKKLSRLLNNFH